MSAPRRKPVRDDHRAQHQALQPELGAGARVDLTEDDFIDCPFLGTADELRRARVGTFSNTHPGLLHKPALNAGLLPQPGRRFLRELKASVARLGVLVPLLVTRQGAILDGAARWTVALHLGLRVIPIQVVHPNPLDPEALVLGPNLHRRHVSARNKPGDVWADYLHELLPHRE